MPLRKILVMVMALALLGAGLPVQAQDGGLSAEEQALLEVVQTAQQDFLALDTYRFSGRQETQQTITSGVGILAVDIRQQLEQQVRGEVARTSDQLDSRQTITQELLVRVTGRSDEQLVRMEVEIVVIDGQLYLQFVEPPRVEGITYPEGWLTLEDAANVPGLENTNLPALVDLAASPVSAYTFDEETVTAIEEVEAEPVREVEVRAFKLTIDPRVAIQETLTDILALETTGNEDFIASLLEDTQVEITIYIGVEDGQIHRVASELTINFEAAAGVLGPDAVAIAQTTTSDIIFIDLNDDIEITAPELSTSEAEDAEDATSEGDAEASTD